MKGGDGRLEVVFGGGGWIFGEDVKSSIVLEEFF